MNETTMRRQQAQEHFLRLLAFDEHRSARSELLAAGVPPYRIEALYGEEFAGLLPGLIAHIKDQGVRVSFADDEWDQGREHLKAIHQSMRGEQYAEANAAYTQIYYPTQFQELFDCLQDAIAGILRSEAAMMARLTWWAHWSMSNRSNILLQDEVDALMIFVHENILDT